MDREGCNRTVVLQVHADKMADNAVECNEGEFCAPRGTKAGAAVTARLGRERSGIVKLGGV